MNIIRTMKDLIDLSENSNQKTSIHINFFSEKPSIDFFHHDERYEGNVEVYHIWNIKGTEEEDEATLENIKSVLKAGVAE